MAPRVWPVQAAVWLWIGFQLVALATGKVSSSFDAAGVRKRLFNLDSHAKFWTRRSPAVGSQQINFKLLLNKKKSDVELRQILQQVSDVRSASYGQYLDAHELQQVWQPSRNALQAVSQLVQQYDNLNSSVVQSFGDHLVLKMPVDVAEQVFATQLHEYVNRQDASLRVVRPRDTYVIPEEIAPFVLFIDGLESLPTIAQAQVMRQKQLNRQRRNPRGSPVLEPAVQLEAQQPTADDAAQAAQFATYATPDKIRKQYGIPSGVNAGFQQQNAIVVATFLMETYSESDLRTFYSTFEAKELPESLMPSHSDYCLSDSPTGEASLDAQVMVAFSGSDSIHMLCYNHLRDPMSPYQDDNQEPFLAFLQDVNAMDPPPGVVSISYTDDECAMPVEYAMAVNHELMKAAMKGISVINSAGDSGVQGSHLAADFCKRPGCSRFEAMFPASSPFITSVGGTKLLLGEEQIDGRFKEVVVSTASGSTVTTGGGFSNLFDQPEYQREAVQQYLKLADQKNLTHLFNTRGRAYPDVAAVGSDFPSFVKGDLGTTDGTSISAPIVASMVALVNKQRLESGRPPLGFLNPLLYQMEKHCPAVFHDVQDGDNACGTPALGCCPTGHFAAPGWDATTGLGTISLETFAAKIDDCLAQIRLEAVDHVRRRQDLLSRGSRMEQSVTEAVYFSSVLAGVALCSVLFTLRHKLFVGSINERYASCGFARDSALEKLLGADDEQ